jgi:deoxyribose-phosphate aldolase
MSATTDALIDAITREVLAQLASDGACACGDPACRGACAARCSDTVRGVVSNGADRISYSGDGAEVPRDLARYIDHTLLRPDATAADIDKLCDEALAYGFAAVCVNPTWVRRCAQRLRGSGVRVASVIGFPFGAGTTEVKALEARRAIRDGAREIDMVINIGALKSGDYELVRRDIEKVADACREAGALSKVIIEAAFLSDEEKVVSSHLAQEAKADFVKTSTGFGPGGATVHDVLLMRETIGPKLGLKAAGGIHSAQEARDMIAAGATRIGASASVQIVTGEEATSGQRY